MIHKKNEPEPSQPEPSQPAPQDSPGVFTALVSSSAELLHAPNWSLDTIQLSELELLELPSVLNKTLLPQRDTLDDVFAASFSVTPISSEDSQLIDAINTRAAIILESLHEEIAELGSDEEHIVSRVGGRGKRGDGATIRWVAFTSITTGEFIIPDFDLYSSETRPLNGEDKSRENFERFSSGEARLLLSSKELVLEPPEGTTRAEVEPKRYAIEPAALISTDCHSEAVQHFLQALRTPTPSFLHSIWELNLNQFLIDFGFVVEDIDPESGSIRLDGFKNWVANNLVVTCEQVISDTQEEACVLSIAPSENSDGRFDEVFQGLTVRCKVTTLVFGDSYIWPRFTWDL